MRGICVFCVQGEGRLGDLCFVAMSRVFTFLSFLSIFPFPTPFLGLPPCLKVRLPAPPPYTKHNIISHTRSRKSRTDVALRLWAPLEPKQKQQSQDQNKEQSP